MEEQQGFFDKDDIETFPTANGMKESSQQHIHNIEKYVVPMVQKLGFNMDWHRGAGVKKALPPVELDKFCTKANRFISEEFNDSSGHLMYISDTMHKKNNRVGVIVHVMRDNSELSRYPNINIPKEMRGKSIGEHIEWLNGRNYYYFILNLLHRNSPDAHCIYFGKFGSLPEDAFKLVTRNKRVGITKPDRLLVTKGKEAFTEELFKEKLIKILYKQ